MGEWPKESAPFSFFELHVGLNSWFKNHMGEWPKETAPFSIFELRRVLAKGAALKALVGLNSCFKVTWAKCQM
jgi:hypothetical protein